MNMLQVKSPNFIRCWLGVAQRLFVDEELNSLGNDQKPEGQKIIKTGIHKENMSCSQDCF